MAQIECGQGHLYDPELYDTCPYCNTNQQMPLRASFPGTPVGAASRTMPPRGYGVKVTAPSKTLPPRDWKGTTVAAAGKTVGLMQDQIGFDPVVGWLACVEGPSRGKSYTIRAGMNAIGRSERMDIAVTGDQTISAENHAKISYSSRNNRFNLVPGDGRNIVYLNGKEVLSATVLSAYDIIDFGKTKLLFVPLCGERFLWEGDPSNGMD